MQKEKPSARCQDNIRLTLRLPEELNLKIRAESARRGNSINQTILYIFNCYFHTLESGISPFSCS